MYCMFWGNIFFHQFPSDQIWVWGGCGAAINCKWGGISDMFYQMNWCYKLHLEKHVIQLSISHLSKKIILNVESIVFKTFDMFTPFGNPLHLYYEMLSTTRFMLVITIWSLSQVEFGQFECSQWYMEQFTQFTLRWSNAFKLCHYRFSLSG